MVGPLTWPTRYHSGPAPPLPLWTSTTVLLETATDGLRPRSYWALGPKPLKPCARAPEGSAAMIASDSRLAPAKRAVASRLVARSLCLPFSLVSGPLRLRAGRVARRYGGEPRPATRAAALPPSRH